MERYTKTLATLGNHTVVVKEYLTTREANGVLKQLFQDQLVSSEQGASVRLSLLVGIDRKIKCVEAAVISLDGSTEHLADRLQDLAASEYAAIFNR